MLRDRVANLIFYPPRPTSDGGLTGAGRVLVCSNYHWLADARHWNGGLWDHRGPPAPGADPGHQACNQVLLLNFLAGAVAARADAGERA